MSITLSFPQIRSDFDIHPPTSRPKIGHGLCDIGALRRCRIYLRKIKPIAIAKLLNILGERRALLVIETKRTDGSNPSRADLFIQTHTWKDGIPVDEKSAEIISKLREIDEAQEGGTSNYISDDIYSKVIGLEQHGRIRGYGLGPTPTSVFGYTSTQYRTNLEEMRVELNTVHA
ncbi:hypothetical protein MRB53_033229 [Persea americana]|uniref:Uncharacterized protein n=1 Tax=Persea americana TaxID=3435 RepID=A0ACC2KTX5_PERAE|nr:hypothetical protein MRB53_033229 [Persea americana]